MSITNNILVDIRSENSKLKPVLICWFNTEYNFEGNWLLTLLRKYHLLFKDDIFHIFKKKAKKVILILILRVFHD